MIIILLFLIKTICCDPSSAPSLWDGTVKMRGDNIWFHAELTKIIPSYHRILLLRVEQKFI